MWEEADLTERRKLLLAMLDAVYVDTVEEKSVVAVRPKPAFRPLLEMATTSAGSGIVPINEMPRAPMAQRQNDCFLVETGESQTTLGTPPGGVGGNSLGNLWGINRRLFARIL